MRTIPYNNRFSVTLNVESAIEEGLAIHQVKICLLRPWSTGSSRKVKMEYSTLSKNNPIDAVAEMDHTTYRLAGEFTEQFYNWVDKPWSLYIEWLDKSGKQLLSCAIAEAFTVDDPRLPMKKATDLVWNLYLRDGHIECDHPTDLVFDNAKYKYVMWTLFGGNYTNIEQELMMYEDFCKLKPKALKYYYVSKQKPMRLWRIYFSNVAVFEFNQLNITAFPKVFPYIFGTNLLK